MVGPAHDLLDDSTFQNLQRLCSSGLVGVAAAAPPCAAFSRARLRQGGPPPVRTLLHPTGIPHPFGFSSQGTGDVCATAFPHTSSAALVWQAAAE